MAPLSGLPAPPLSQSSSAGSPQSQRARRGPHTVVASQANAVKYNTCFNGAGLGRREELNLGLHVDPSTPLRVAQKTPLPKC